MRHPGRPHPVPKKPEGFPPGSRGRPGRRPSLRTGPSSGRASQRHPCAHENNRAVNARRNGRGRPWAPQQGDTKRAIVHMHECLFDSVSDGLPRRRSADGHSSMLHSDHILQPRPHVRIGGLHSCSRCLRCSSFARLPQLRHRALEERVRALNVPIGCRRSRNNLQLIFHGRTHALEIELR